MAQCDYCGKGIQTLSTFTCSYCGKTFCPEHRLPFNHDCAHIEAWKQTPPPNQKKTEQKAARRNQMHKNTLPSTYAIKDTKGTISPIVIILSIVVLILIGIAIGMYMF